MNGTRTIRAIRFNNILSFGAFEGEFKLEPLNVLIGPNTSGKSNLIEVLSLLAAMPRDLLVPIREGGGITEWLWKGADTSTATIDVTLDFPPGPVPIRHRLALTSTKGRLEVVDEAIEGAWPTGDYPQPYIYYAYQAGRPVLNVLPEGSQRDDWSSRRLKQLRREDVSPEQSILSQRRDVDLYPELTFLSSQYSRFKFYRQWNLGRYTEPRLPQKVDLPEDHLLENASNLGIVINNLLNIPSVRNSIRDRLRAFSDDFEDLTTRIHGGTVQIYLHERGLRQSIPATRLSDGTLRYLCLLAILSHPEPPGLVCVEEPELGLHPDIIPTVAELLLDASQRSQLIVTTHSDALVTAFSETPEAVVVTERDSGGTRLARLEADSLREWLERYRLGELWQMGEIGGTRW